jgi:hypothetical protein
LSSKKPKRTAAERAVSWEATLELCKVKEPVLYNVYNALNQLGMMKRPTDKRSEYQCLQMAHSVIALWRDARSPLADAFVAGFGYGPNLLISEDAFQKIQKWPADAPYARTLLDHAGVQTLSELVHVTGDSSTGVKVPGARPFAGGCHLVPKDQAMDDGHGGHVRKPKRQKLGTGNGPARFKCHRSGCGHAWNPELSAIHRDGWARCKCGAQAKPEA